MNTKDITKPEFQKDISGYTLTWRDLDLKLRLERMNDDAKGEMIVRAGLNGDGKPKKELLRTAVNLMSSTSMTQVVKRLTKHMELDWDSILSYATLYVVEDIRNGGEDDNINQEPVTMKIEYLLDPILPLNEPATIYTAGGKCKSIFADYLAVLVQFGIASDNGLPFIPNKANVLYLDWEADQETHRRYITAIKRGLNVSDSEILRYRQINHPLSQVIDSIRATVARNDIGLVIIDSQMAATASATRGMTEAQVASEYYNLIKSLRCTTLTIDHITKTGMTAENGVEAPYGSVVKYNRSRSQFELRLPEDDDDQDHKEFALHHRKFNLGRKQKPIGVALDFENRGNELVSIKFSLCEIAENPSLSKTLTLKEQLINALKVLGKASIKDLAEHVGALDKRDSIGTTLSREKRTFIKISDGVYGLLANHQAN